MLPNLGVMVLVMRLVSGISLTPRARSSNPGVEVVARCICEENRCSICASNVLSSSDIMLLIMSSTFIVRASNAVMEWCFFSNQIHVMDVAVAAVVVVVVLAFRCSLLGFQVCSVAWEPRGCEQRSLSFENSMVWLAASPQCSHCEDSGTCLGVESHQLILENLVLSADVFHLTLLSAGFPVKVPPDVHDRLPFCSMNIQCRMAKGPTVGVKL
ncbi:hypothetical protein TIFTF001_048049 [Ficus carica]|nr:hypothetical protein TIFTF001_048049 [Ficus carica]